MTQKQHHVAVQVLRREIDERRAGAAGLLRSAAAVNDNAHAAALLADEANALEAVLDEIGRAPKG